LDGRNADVAKREEITKCGCRKYPHTKKKGAHVGTRRSKSSQSEGCGGQSGVKGRQKGDEVKKKERGHAIKKVAAQEKHGKKLHKKDTSTLPRHWLRVHLKRRPPGEKRTARKDDVKPKKADGNNTGRQE